MSTQSSPTFDWVKNFHLIKPYPKTVKTSLILITTRREQPASPTRTQGEQESTKHGIGVPLPLVGRPGACGQLVSQGIRDHHSTTMVRVPGSSGDAGFNREFLRKEVKIKTEPGIEATE